MEHNQQSNNTRNKVLNALVGLLVVILIVAVYYYIRSFREVEPQMNTEPSQTLQSNTSSSQTNTSNSDTVYTDTDRLIVDIVMKDLDIPWDITFTPDKVMLVNERSGRLLARMSDGSSQIVEADFSDLWVRGELGLMGMTVDPNFTDNRRLYTCQGNRQAGRVQVVAWSINEDYTQAKRVDDPLIGDIPAANIHDGCRLRFGSQGYLWISTGDAAQGSNPQDLNSLAGKILRVNAITGQAAPDNPFNTSKTAELIYSFGHRNPQGLAWRPGTQQMWVVEHGPDIDDEINLLVEGGNYGWDPVSSSSDYYQRVPMTDTDKYPDAIEAQWSSGNPTLATSGAIFLEGQQWGSREGWLAVATLKNRSIHLFKFDEAGKFIDRFVMPELNDSYGRLRSPIIGPDNALYVTTSNGGGDDVVLRVTPKSP